MAEKKATKKTAGTVNTATNRQEKKLAKEAALQAEAEAAVVAAIAKMPGLDRKLGEGLHALIKANAPTLSPKLWYGMPAYARDGKIVCFFQSAQRFKTRYATFGFMHEAKLDEGNMWPTAFALKGFSTAEEARISALLKKAAR
jgi:uncharacterized protein YdhG (YjbR/CyaY superfamily)